MKFALALIACPIAALAASVSGARQSALDGPFTARLSSRNVVNKAVNSSSGQFFINTPTETYCPGGVVDCSNFTGTETVFVLGDDTRIGLQVEVPGGQQVYIGPDGALSFTPAHSAYIPPGSIVNGFSREQGIGPNEVYLRIANRQWYICPLPENVYQVFAFNVSHDNCFEVAINTFVPQPGNVWEYI
ncbi:hypothetical protein CIB48_g3130 [Xylaria polymorpha]|nr:hypothetical protein CIB48_g3130 [Xylaria polymorpha]